MSKKKKHVLELPKIGQLMYAVHKKSSDEQMNAVRVIPCRVKTYVNLKNKVQPVLAPVGFSKQEVNVETHYIYEKLCDAVKKITY